MAGTLYDLLEVSRSASRESIVAAYHRLHAKFSEPAASGDEDAINHLVALREAHRILANPESRRKYDERLDLQQSEQLAAHDSSISFAKVLPLVSLLAVSGLFYAKYQSEQEKARLAQEQVAASVRAAELEAQRERDQRFAESQAEQQRLRAEALERNEREREIAYGRQVSHELERAEVRLRIERERAERERANAERQKQYDYERQLSKEKALARQMELERLRYR